MKPHELFQEHAFDDAISSFDIEMLAHLIRDALLDGRSHRLLTYFQEGAGRSISNGVLQLTILTSLGMRDFLGLDIDPFVFFSRLQDVKSYEALEVARGIIMSELKTQVHEKNTFFLRVDRLQSSEAAVLVKDIIDVRRTELEELCQGSPSLEELAATYYGFQLLTSQIRRSELGEDIQRLFECLGLSTLQEVTVRSDVLNPEEVMFRNVSAQTRALLRDILYLTEYNSNERAKAAGRLGELADPRVEPYLSRATRDEYSWVRRAAVSALGQIRLLEDPRCVVDLLKDIDEGTRHAALESVVLIGTRTVPLLLDILEGYEGLSYSDSLEAAKKSHPRALDNLDAFLQYHSRTTRVLAAKALGRIGERMAIPRLERALQDEDVEVRSAVQSALLDIEAPRSYKRIT